MDDTPLNLSLWIHSLDGFFEAWKSIHTEEQHIFHPTVPQVVEHSKPELAGFICKCLKTWRSVIPLFL